MEFELKFNVVVVRMRREVNGLVQVKKTRRGSKFEAWVTESVTLFSLARENHWMEYMLKSTFSCIAICLADQFVLAFVGISRS